MESESGCSVHRLQQLGLSVYRAYQWQEQLESGEFESLEDLAKDFGVNRG